MNNTFVGDEPQKQPYRYSPYPKMVYSQNATRIVHSPEELNALGPEWGSDASVYNPPNTAPVEAATLEQRISRLEQSFQNMLVSLVVKGKAKKDE